MGWSMINRDGENCQDSDRENYQAQGRPARACETTRQREPGVQDHGL